MTSDDLVARLRARAFRLATMDMNGDGAALAKEAADALEAERAARVKAEQECKDWMWRSEQWRKHSYRWETASRNNSVALKAAEARLAEAYERAAKVADADDGMASHGMKMEYGPNVAGRIAAAIRALAKE